MSDAAECCNKTRRRSLRLTPGRFVSGCWQWRRRLGCLSGSVGSLQPAQGLDAADRRGEPGAGDAAVFFWFLAALLFRVRFQYSIRSLLSANAVVAILGSWVADARKQAREQRSVNELEKAGVDIFVAVCT